jgi:hypothetical protein
MMMAVTPTLKPRCKCKRPNNHPYVDDIPLKHNEVDRGSEDDEVMQDNMDNHGTSTQDPHKNY